VNGLGFGLGVRYSPLARSLMHHYVQPPPLSCVQLLQHLTTRQINAMWLSYSAVAWRGSRWVVMVAETVCSLGEGRLVSYIHSI